MDQDTIALKQGQFYNKREQKFKEGFSDTGLQDLQTQYSTTLLNYESADELLNQEKLDTINRIDSSNPYLNKNLRFSNGTIGYVTNKGVFKYYSTMNILNGTAGKNMCPSGWEQLDQSYDNPNVPNTVIPTTPNLIAGSMMLQGQSCGNEGNNVYVTELTNVDASYLGCYNDSSVRAMTMQDNGSSAFSYDTCKLRAIETGSQYFGLQNYKGPNDAQCALSNDLTTAEQYGPTPEYVQSPALWASNTNGTAANAAMLLPNSALAVMTNNENSVIASIGNPQPECEGYGSVQNINATYGANCNAQGYNVPNGNMTSAGYMSALQNQTDINYVVGTNSSNPTGGYIPDPAYGCMKAFDMSYTCGNVPQSVHLNGEAGGQNVILNCTSQVNYCATMYCLLLQDDGNMVIIQLEDADQDPNSYVGNYLWSSNTSTPNSPNSAWVAINGLTKTNYLKPNIILQANDWIGSTNGTTRLIMQTDGNLVLYTSTPSVQCETQSDGNVYGGSWVNAIYKVSNAGGVATIQNMNKIGYVDENSDLHEYPTSMIGLSTNYQIYEQYDSWSNDLPNMPMQNTTVEYCTTACNNNADCTGFTYDSTSQNCVLKSKVFPAVNKQPSATSMLYAKKPQIMNDQSCPKNYAEISTMQWQNYNQTNEMTSTTKCGVSEQTVNQSNIVNTLGATLSNLSTQISNNISSIVMPTPVNTTNAEKQFKLYNNINRKMDKGKNFEGMTNYDLDEMEKSTGLIVLQKNYIFIFWSLFTILIALYLFSQFRH